MGQAFLTINDSRYSMRDTLHKTCPERSRRIRAAKYERRNWPGFEFFCYHRNFAGLIYDRAGKRWTLKEMFDIMYDPKAKECL